MASLVKHSCDDLRWCPLRPSRVLCCVDQSIPLQYVKITPVNPLQPPTPPTLLPTHPPTPFNTPTGCKTYHTSAAQSEAMFDSVSSPDGELNKSLHWYFKGGRDQGRGHETTSKGCAMGTMRPLTGYFWCLLWHCRWVLDCSTGLQTEFVCCLDVVALIQYRPPSVHRGVILAIIILAI